jgi:predicted dehydrogenase
MKKYKLCFIGGGIGSIAGNPHYIAARMDNRFELLGGVFSSRDEISEKTADLRDAEAFSDPETMLDKLNPDAVVVLTPTPMHYDNISMLLRRNLPVICEKPLVSSVDEAEKLKKAAAGKFLVVTNNYSGYPMLRELKARIERGDLGDIINIRLQMPQETFMRPPKNIKYPQPWRLKDGVIPMICLDLGVHLHHLMFFLTSKKPKKVMAEFNSFSKYNVIDDVNIWLEFEDSSKASMWMSKAALGHRNGMAVEVFGTKCSASWVQMNPEILNLSYFDGRKTIIDRGCECLIANQPRYARMTSGHPAGFIEAFANLYYDIADSLDSYFLTGSSQNPYVFGLEHALEGLNIFQTAGKAHNAPNWFNLD